MLESKIYRFVNSWLSLKKVIPTASFDYITKNYGSALSWLEMIGVKLGSGRTKFYRKTIEYWNAKYMISSAEDGEKIFSDFISSMLEIADFIAIYEAFKNEPLSNLKAIQHKLQKGVNGSTHIANETTLSSTARNLVFEALVAARMHNPSSGMSAILDAPSDTGVNINSTKFWIECKRIRSIKKIEANVRKAFDQLEKTFKHKKGANHRGLIAIDVSKIINEDDCIYVQNSDEELLNSIDKIMDEFIAENSNEWEKVFRLKNRKILGIIIRFSFMATSESRNLLVHANQWAINPRIGITSKNKALLHAIKAGVKIDN